MPRQVSYRGVVDHPHRAIGKLIEQGCRRDPQRARRACVGRSDEVRLLPGESARICRWDPATSVLTRLTPDEQDLYSDLVADGLGERGRLEQERIGWRRVAQRLPTLDGARM